MRASSLLIRSARSIAPRASPRMRLQSTMLQDEEEYDDLRSPLSVCCLDSNKERRLRPRDLLGYGLRRGRASCLRWSTCGAASAVSLQST